MLNTAPAPKNDMPHTMERHEMLCLPRKMRLRVRLPSIFITCHKVPCMPRNLRGVTTSLSPPMRFAKNTQHDTSKVLRVPRKMNMDTSNPKCCACHEKYNLCSENHAKVLRLSHKMTFEYFRHFLTRNVGDVGRCMEMLCR